MKSVFYCGVSGNMEKRKMVAVCIDALSSNESLALEDSVIMDRRNVLANIDSLGQSNGVMLKKHPTTVKRILHIVFSNMHGDSKNIIE
uniref:Transcriptional regulator n=1 Tax=Rhabditophanes sp. KR3021 TaxID=114890 RepID=A0AC35UIF1_9BILA